MVWGHSLWSELLGGSREEAGLVSAPLRLWSWCRPWLVWCCSRSSAMACLTASGAGDGRTMSFIDVSKELVSR